MRVMTRERFYTLPEWQRNYWTKLLNLYGWSAYRCFEFTYIGPILIGAGLFKADDHGRAYLDGSGDVAREFRGLSG